MSSASFSLVPFHPSQTQIPASVALPQPAKDLMYAERALNGGSRTYSQLSMYTEIKPQYQPQSQSATFEVPELELLHGRVYIYLANPDQKLLARYVQTTTASFFIHPQFYQDPTVPHMTELTACPKITEVVSESKTAESDSDSESEDIQEEEAAGSAATSVSLAVRQVEVMPTASSRTVLVLKNTLPLHCLKLHCPARISRFNRKLTHYDIQKSVATSKDLDRAIQQGKFPAVFGFLPESIGVAMKVNKKSWGYLIREMTPHPIVADAEKRTLLPLFSLYSSDLNNTTNDKHVPLLVKLIEKSKLDPMDFILNKVMLRIIESWCFLAKELGFLAQGHGQNLLLEVGSDGIPTRIIFRDLSTYMDRKARVAKGLSNEDFPIREKTTNPEIYLRGDDKIMQGYYSLIYDSFVGHHLFTYLAKVAKEKYQIPEEVLMKACQENFRKFFPDADKFFPKNVFYYSEACVDGIRQDLTDTGQAPHWR